MVMNDYGFYRVACAVPKTNVGDIQFNTAEIINCIEKATDEGVRLLSFPELSVTSYTCADLFADNLLLDKTERAIFEICRATKDSGMIVVVGAPLRLDSFLLNCAVVISQGKVMGVVPKTYLPNYKEFYEKRWFNSGSQCSDIKQIKIGGQLYPFGTDLMFESNRVKIAIDICEDMWVPIPPSSVAALNGANVIVNLSASNELIGKHNRLKSIVKRQSSQCVAAYIYASAGFGESSTDLVFSGNILIAENGNLLAEGDRFCLSSQMKVADVDVEALSFERRITQSFSDSSQMFAKPYRVINVEQKNGVNYDAEVLFRNIKKCPFVPADTNSLNSRCDEITDIQSHGLARRLNFTGIKSIVVGISGGLDSTLALLVAVRAFDKLGLDRKNIYGITMPGFGTTGRTHDNAVALMNSLGVTAKEISISAAVTQHFKDIGQSEDKHDVTYENSQARERTQILMDFANKVNALVLGTGDLSELALGWATYNGDHMSMYNVNGSIPKTLAQYLVRWFALNYTDNSTMRSTLLDILDTPISPELTPADENGNIAQKTEDLIGPYELHDFFLYNIIRFGYAPSKVYLLAKKAFAADFDNATILKWLRTFYRRFFQQQFKRSCMPDGPKVGTISLSPRGDWRMPSDACSRLWLSECENLHE